MLVSWRSQLHRFCPLIHMYTHSQSFVLPATSDRTSSLRQQDKVPVHVQCESYPREEEHESLVRTGVGVESVYGLELVLESRQPLFSSPCFLFQIFESVLSWYLSIADCHQATITIFAKATIATLLSFFFLRQAWCALISPSVETCSQQLSFPES